MDTLKLNFFHSIHSVENMKSEGFKILDFILSKTLPN